MTTTGDQIPSSARIPSSATALATPWTGVRLAAAPVQPVAVPRLPAPIGGIGGPQRLVTPWQDVAIRVPDATASPVLFTSLAAPVTGAAIPAPRGTRELSPRH